MTTKEDMERLFPTSRQEGGDHYKKTCNTALHLYNKKQFVIFSRQCY
jgi:hypothetical protein